MKGPNKIKTPQLDMNPMVDMAFLLVTFFLLATTFKTPEPTNLVVPRSVSKTNLPDSKLIIISINKTGAVFFSVSENEIKIPLLEKMAELNALTINSAEKEVFQSLPGFGVSVADLCDFLRLSSERRRNYVQKGIPIDSSSNELADWAIFARTLVSDARFAIKADKSTPYHKVEAVIQTLTDNNIMRFNLVTEIKRADGI